MDPSEESRPSGSLVNNELMSLLDQHISCKLVSFQSRMAAMQKNITDSKLSKIKEDMLTNDNYVIKRKSYEDQFKFNIKLSTKLKDADRAVKSGDAVAASENISEGLDLLSNRQKVICLANSGDLG